MKETAQEAAMRDQHVILISDRVGEHCPTADTSLVIEVNHPHREIFNHREAFPALPVLVKEMVVQGMLTQETIDPEIHLEWQVPCHQPPTL